MLSISELFVYPIKSLAGIKLNRAVLTDRGFEYDRRWMLIDDNNRFLSQREVPGMALLQPTFLDQQLLITDRRSGGQLYVPIQQQQGDIITCQIWDDFCHLQLVSSDADAWFSERLEKSCKLVYMPNASRRPVEANYAINEDITNLSDAYPLLLIGQASLDDLNCRLDVPVPINRFRPNIVYTGGTPYQEDELYNFKVGAIEFFGVKRCARCPIPTINQENASRSQEPLKTMANFRMRNNKIYFGMNLLFKGAGSIGIGDQLLLID